MAELADLCRFYPVAGGTGHWTVDRAVQGFLDDIGSQLIDGAEYHVRSEGRGLLNWEVSTGLYDAATRTIARSEIDYSSNGGSIVDYDEIPQCGIVTLARDVGAKLTFGLGDPTAVVRDGTSYINDSNQDFWLRESGVWVRKGNIRDEGAGGIVNIAPVTALGFAQSVSITRTRFLESTLMDLGASMSAVLTRSRMVAASMHLGFDMSVARVERIKTLAASMALGANVDAVLSHASIVIELEAALGFSMDVQLLRERWIAASMAFGVSQDSVPELDEMLQASMGVGVSMDASLVLVREIAASMAMGFDEAASLIERTRYLGSVDVALGSVQASPADRVRALSATMALGSLQTSVPVRSRPLAATMDVGVSETVAVLRSRYLSASMGLGFTQASALTHASANQFLAITDTASPFVRVFNASLTKFSDPATLPSNGVPTACAATSGRFAVARTTQVYVYDVSSSAVTYNRALTITSGAGTQFMKFSADGSRLMVIARGTSPYITIFNTSTWSSVTAPTPGQVVNAADFSPDGATIAVALNASPFLKLYRTSDMTAITSPGTLPTAAANGIAYSPNGSHFAVVWAGATNDTVTVYRTSDLAVAATITLVGHVANSGNGYPAWSGDGLEMALGTNSTPFLGVWSRSGDTFTAQTLSATPSGAVYTTYLSKDGLTMFTVASKVGGMQWDQWTRSGGTWTKQTAPSNQPGGSDILSCMAGTL
jgi:hypothetical protein